MFSLKITFLFLAIFVASTTSEIVDFHYCENGESECPIKEVHISPCKDFELNTACKIRRRKPAKMMFEFVPNFDSEKLEASLSWVKSEEQDLPLATLDSNACNYMSCPIKTGVTNRYEIDVPIENRFPLNTYTIKWLLKSPSSGKSCCFTTDIKVVR